MSGEAVLGTNFKRYAREQNQVKSDMHVGKEAKVHLSKLTEFLSLIGKNKQTKNSSSRKPSRIKSKKLY